jgi:Spy/CpxP family protein refolding chaperone
MKKGLVAVVAMALMLLVPSVMLFAQEEKAAGAKETKEMKHMKMTLTDEQKAKIKEIRTATRLKVIDARATIEKEQIMLREEIQKDQPNKTEIEATLRKLADARVAMQTARIEGLIEVRQILGPEWKSMMKERRMGNAEQGESEMEESESEESDNPSFEHMRGGTQCPMGMGMGMGMMGRDRRVLILRGEREGMRARGTRGWRMVRPGYFLHEGPMTERGEGMMRSGSSMGMGMGGNMMYRREGMGMGEMGRHEGGRRVIIRRPGGMGMGMSEGGRMMMEKGGEGAGSPMSGCMKGGEMSGAKRMKMEGATETSGESGWKTRSAYRPHTWNMGDKTCTGKCKHEMKVKVEVKE